MRITAYVHSTKESMYDLGKRSGLKGAALDMFMYACLEVKLELEVNEETGEATIIRVDDRTILQV